MKNILTIITINWTNFIRKKLDLIMSMKGFSYLKDLSKLSPNSHHSLPFLVLMFIQTITMATAIHLESEDLHSSGI